jgi:predicted RNA polymerase sigma factor
MEGRRGLLRVEVGQPQEEISETVLGLDAVRIAHAFLVSPTTMGQRLVRAKTKIRDGGIQFEVPQLRELPQRLDAVLEAIYAAFGIAWDDMAGVDQRGRDLAEEAIWLARVLLQLMPGEAEVCGLLALMLHCGARRRTRRGPDGRYIPLSEQDSQQWSLPLIEEAERHLAVIWLSGASVHHVLAQLSAKHHLSQLRQIQSICDGWRKGPAQGGRRHRACQKC